MFKDSTNAIGKIRFVPLVAAVIWLFGSAAAAMWGSPGFFARFGAVGVGLLIVGFTVTRVAYDNYLRQLQSWSATGVGNAVKATGSAIEVLSKLGNPMIKIPDEHREQMEVNRLKIVETYHNVGNVVEELDAVTTEYSEDLMRQTWLEVLMVTFATLQWGFADVLIQRFHEFG